MFKRSTSWLKALAAVWDHLHFPPCVGTQMIIIHPTEQLHDILYDVVAGTWTQARAWELIHLAYTSCTLIQNATRTEQAEQNGEQACMYLWLNEESFSVSIKLKQPSVTHLPAQADQAWFHCSLSFRLEQPWPLRAIIPPHPCAPQLHLTACLLCLTRCTVHLWAWRAAPMGSLCPALRLPLCR